MTPPPPFYLLFFLSWEFCWRAHCSHANFWRFSSLLSTPGLSDILYNDQMQMMMNKISDGIRRPPDGIVSDLVFRKIPVFRLTWLPQNEVIPQSPDIAHFLYSVCIPQSPVSPWNCKLPLNIKLHFDTSYHYQDMGNFMFPLPSKWWRHPARLNFPVD